MVQDEIKTLPTFLQVAHLLPLAHKETQEEPEGQAVARATIAARMESVGFMGFEV